MLIIKTIPLLQEYTQKVRQKNKKIALIPTMGCLHDGHIRLINEAKLYADIIMVSIFVNPMQFDCIDDFMRYPRTFDQDSEKLNNNSVNSVFAPTQLEMYPAGIKKTTYINVPGISTILEGASRLKHFRGVSTIISKLFNLIKPNIAFFGEKDYQQLVLIRQMVYDMNYDINVIGVPIVRAKDGLALSSRNNYLTPEQREIAPTLNKIINIMANRLKENRFLKEEIITFAKKQLSEKGFFPDVIQIRDADTLLELANSSKKAIILLSAWLGKARLIDNQIVDLNTKEKNS